MPCCRVAEGVPPAQHPGNKGAWAGAPSPSFLQLLFCCFFAQPGPVIFR